MPLGATSPDAPMRKLTTKVDWLPGSYGWDKNHPIKPSLEELRHTWRPVAADLGINELQAQLLLGHSLIGISQSQITRAIVRPGLRAAQRAISRRIISLLGAA